VPEWSANGLWIFERQSWNLPITSQLWWIELHFWFSSIFDLCLMRTPEENGPVAPHHAIAFRVLSRVGRNFLTGEFQRCSVRFAPSVRLSPCQRTAVPHDCHEVGDQSFHRWSIHPEATRYQVKWCNETSKKVIEGRFAMARQATDVKYFSYLLVSFDWIAIVLFTMTEKLNCLAGLIVLCNFVVFVRDCIPQRMKPNLRGGQRTNVVKRNLLHREGLPPGLMDAKGIWSMSLVIPRLPRSAINVFFEPSERTK